MISVRNPRLPKLTPRIGTSRAGPRDPAGHPDERAVAAQHDEQIALVREIVARRPSAVPAGTPASLAVSVSKTGWTPRASSQPASSASTPDAASRPRLAVRPTRVIASAMSQVQEELAIAFGAGDRRLGHRDARQS